MIHQPNAPLWQIKGWETGEATQNKGKNKKGKSYNQNLVSHQLHIAYHGGDHYDSVRRLGDTSHVPANIQIDVEGDVNEEASQNSNATSSVSDYDTCNIHEINQDGLSVSPKA